MSELNNCLTATYGLHLTSDTKEIFNFLEKCCKSATNTWNRTNYLFKKYVNENNGKIPSYLTIRKLLTGSFDEAVYGNQEVLTVSLAKEVVRMVGKCWQSHKGLLSLKSKGQYSKPIRQPHFKSHNALTTVYITQQSIVKSSAKKGYFRFSNCPDVICRLPVSYERMRYAGIVPKPGYFRIEMVYASPVMSVESSKRNLVYAGVDLGVTNLAVVTIDKKNVRPLIIDGKSVKSWNIFYNRVISGKKSRLTKAWFGRGDVEVLKPIRTSKSIELEWDNRDKFMNSYMHWASRQIVGYCKFFGVTDIVIGRNKEWKQNLKKSKRLNRRTRRHFASIPFNIQGSPGGYSCSRNWGVVYV